MRRKKGMLAGALLVVFLGGLGYRAGDGWAVLERAALISAVLSMPQGGAALLERRFAGELEQWKPSSESEVAPYIKPWIEQKDPASATGEQNGQSLEGLDGGGQKSRVAEDREALPLHPPAEEAAGIPKEYTGEIVQEVFSHTSGGVLFYDQAALKNYTEQPDEEIVEIMGQGMPFTLEGKGMPEVLIIHTHATEAFEPADTDTFDLRQEWRSRNQKENMVAVGKRLKETLEGFGISVLHDTTQHDYPSYAGAYERSAETIDGYLEKYPSIKIVLDVHRDAIFRGEETIVKPVVQTAQGKAAQVMIITGCEDGTMNVPNWRQNLRFAAQLQNAMEIRQANLTRPIFFCHRKYNMDKTTGSLLLEFGSHANTLEEALLSAKLVGEALGTLLTAEKTDS